MLLCNRTCYSKNPRTKPQTPPLPLAWRGPPSNTAMPRPIPRTSPNRNSDSSCTFTQLAAKSPLVMPQNYPFSLTDPQTQLPVSSLYPSNLPSQMASRSGQPFFYNALDRQTNRQTDKQTNRWIKGKFDHYRPLSLYREQHSLIIASLLLLLLLLNVTDWCLDHDKCSITNCNCLCKITHCHPAHSLHCILKQYLRRHDTFLSPFYVQLTF